MAKRKPIEQLSPEYRRRIEKGTAEGKSYRASAGHPEIAPEKAKYDERLREAQRMIKKGRSRASVARELRIAPERIAAARRTYPLKENVEMTIFTEIDGVRGVRVEILVNSSTASYISRYLNALYMATKHQDSAELEQFMGTDDEGNPNDVVTDLDGTQYVLETDLAYLVDNDEVSDIPIQSDELMIMQLPVV